MINVSEDFRNLQKEGNRYYLADLDVTLKDETVLHFDNETLTRFESEDSVSDDNSLTALGAAVINQIEFDIDNVSEDYSEYDFEGAKVDAMVGLTIPHYNYTDYESTETAEIIRFNTPFSAPLKSLNVQLDAVQNLHGYEKPWPAGGGKNILPPPSTWETGKSLNNGTGAERDLNDAALTDYIPVTITANSPYYVSGLDHADIDRYYRTYVAAYNTNKEFLGRTGGVIGAEYPLTVSSFSSGTPQGTGDIAFIRVTIYPVTGYTADFADIIAAIEDSAQIEKGSVATAYEPYSNICPISGHTEVVVDSASKTTVNLLTATRFGKNLLPRTASGSQTINGVTFTVNDDGSVTMNGTATANTDFEYSVNAPVNLNGDYIISGINGGSQSTWRFRFLTRDASGTASAWFYVNADEWEKTLIGAVSIVRFTVLVANGTTLDNVTVYPMIRRADDTDPTYEPYYPPAPLDKPVYGGTVDLVTGVLTVTHGYVDLGTLTWQTRYTGSTNKTLSALPPYLYNKRIGLEAICDKYPIVAQVRSISELNAPDSKKVGIYGYIYQTVQPFYMVLPISDTPSGNICYKLAEPQTFQLTLAQIKALAGGNVIWSSTGNVSAEYYTAREEISPTIEEFRFGTYTVDEALYRGGTITITALDNMSKLDKPYQTSLIYPVSIQSVVNEICSACDVVLATQEYPHRAYQVAAAPVEETTYREVLSWCAQICGCFARFNKRGQLELSWFDQETLETYADVDEGLTPEVLGMYPFTSVKSQDIGVDDVVVTGVQIAVKTEDGIENHLEGTIGYVIAIEDNGFITGENADEIAGWLGMQIIGLTYRKAAISALSDPTIEAGDVGFAIDRQDRRYPVLITKSKFKIGGLQAVVSAAETPSRNSATRFSAAVKTYVEARKMVEQEKSDREVAEAALAEAIASSGGLYSSHVTEQGGGVTYYLHNKPTLAQSDVQMRVTDEAVGVTADGGNTWYGLTVTGQMVVNAISTVGLSADFISSGTLDASRITVSNLYAESIQYDEDSSLVDALESMDTTLTGRINAAQTNLSNEIEATNQLIEGLSNDINPLLQSMTITPQDGLKMSALGSESAVQILNDRINFLVGSQVSAYLTSAGFHFDRGILTQSLSIGNFMWVYDENSGHLRLIFRN